MPTQKDIADHLGISQSEVSRHMSALAIDWRTASMDAIRLAYMTHLRGIVAGTHSADGIDLARERALTEQVDRDLKLLTLAEKRGQLVNVAQLEPALTRQRMTFAAELAARDVQLKDELDRAYGVDIDLELIRAHTRNALSHLSGLDGPAGEAAPQHLEGQ